MGVETKNATMADQLALAVRRAKLLLEAEGFVVLRAKSHRHAQERQRIAEAERRLEAEHTRAWANKAFDEMRQLSDRCTYLYGLAARHGATDDELAGRADEPAVVV
jgi:hypothetical protein